MSDNTPAVGEFANLHDSRPYEFSAATQVDHRDFVQHDLSEWTQAATIDPSPFVFTVEQVNFLGDHFLRTLFDGQPLPGPGLTQAGAACDEGCCVTTRDPNFQPRGGWIRPMFQVLELDALPGSRAYTFRAGDLDDPLVKLVL